jgi:UDPglucose 6-dehydrogenase
MRDAPSLAILPNLIDKGATIHAHDPQGVEEAKKLLPEKIVYFDDIYEAITGADAIVLMTEWNEYRGLDLERIKGLMQGDVFVDLRNVYETKIMDHFGFRYSDIGR